MISRTALRRVGATQPRLSSSFGARQLSFAHASTRPSAVALGKRPIVLASVFAVAPLGAGSSRQLSWTPWRKETPLPSSELPSASSSTLQSAPTTSHESIISSSHPDLTTQSASTSSPALTTPADSLSSTADAASLLPQPPADAITPTLSDLILHSGKSLEEVLNSEEAIHAAMKVSDLPLLGYEHGMFSISGWFTEAIVGIHTAWGVPWWGTIALITVAIRLCLFPVLISTQKHNARLVKVNPDLQKLMAKVTEAKKNGDIHAQAMLGQAMRGLMSEHNVHPLRTLVMPAVQIPIFLTFFNIVRGLANLPLPQLKEGGFGWVTDLTVADPYYILPVTSLIFTNLVFKLGADGMNPDMKSSTPARTAHMRNFIQIATFASFPLVAYFPAAILFYWTSASAFTLVQTLVLRIPALKDYLGIPNPPKPIFKPGEKAIEPSYMDTVRAVQEWWKESMERAQTQHSARMEEMAESKRLESGKSRAVAGREESTGFVEKIQESSPSPRLTGSAAAAPSSSAGSTSSRRVDPRQVEKQRRIEQARQKRARQ